jgi:hypothetical protein
MIMPEVAKVHLENLCGRASLTLRNHSESSQFCELLGRESAGIGSDLPIKNSGSLGDWSAWVGWAAAECRS